LNTLLYSAIYNSKKRLAPAITKQEAANPLKEKIFKYLRVLSPLSVIPIKINPDYRFFLDGGISINSKSGTVYRELVSSGISKNQIWHRGTNRKTLLSGYLIILIRLPWLLGFFLKNLKSLKGLDLISLQVFVGYAAYKQFFRKHKNLVPIIISDLSPSFLMQWSGALAAGNKILWWQDDYHHFKGFSEENYFPYKCDFAAILNQYGLETVRSRSPKVKVYLRHKTHTKAFKSVISTPRLGVAVNASFTATRHQIKILDQLKQQLNLNYVYVRLHPTSKLCSDDFKEDWIRIAPKQETLEDYINKVDVVIVGNSAVQLKLLCEGLPVIHISGLDRFEFDLYGYCELGFSYGIQKDIGKFSWAEVQEFYKEETIQKKLYKYVNVKEKVAYLKEFSF
jgi:hypothetical protein